MNGDTELLSRRAAHERQRLSAAFDALEAELDALADWRAYVRREPGIALGVAAVGGMLLGAATASRRSPREVRQHRRPALRRAGEAVAGSAVTALLMRRASGMLLDYLADLAVTPRRGRDADLRPRPERDAHEARRGA